MKIILIALLSFFAGCSSMLAQTRIDAILSEIENNNLSLKAMRQDADAEKTGHKTGSYLQNPEVEFHFLRSNPAVIGNRTDLSITQSFDFPTAYGYRRQIAGSRDLQTEFRYQKERNDLLLSARLLCAGIIYANAFISESDKRISYARKISDAYKAMFEKGETGILEHNKAQLNLLNLRRERETLVIERDAGLMQLTALNGGKAIDLSETSLQLPLLPVNFEEWYSRAEQTNPYLLWLRQEVEISHQTEKLSRALALPKASAGYLSEQIPGEEFRGVSFGISIPLWENKNTVKYTRARTIALQSQEADSKLQFYNQLKIEYEKAVRLQAGMMEYSEELKTIDNEVLLNKALDLGEISLINYLTELSMTYTAIDHLLKTAHEFNKSYAFLKQYEM